MNNLDMETSTKRSAGEAVAKIVAMKPAILLPGDYEDKDGDIRCGVCHEKKIKKLSSSLSKDPIIAGVQCACARAKTQKEEAERARRAAEQELVRKQSVCFSTQGFSGNYLNRANVKDEKVHEIATQYVKNWKRAKERNLGLLLWGDVGTGKTYVASCIANELMKKGETALMRNLSDFMNCTFEERSELYKEVKNCSLFILDDFGMERDTEYGKETVFQVINTRYGSRKPILITTNLLLSDFKNPSAMSDKRVYDRILEMTSPVQVTGGSIRQEIHAAKLDEMKELFAEVNE